MNIFAFVGLYISNFESFRKYTNVADFAFLLAIKQNEFDQVP